MVKSFLYFFISYFFFFFNIFFKQSSKLFLDQPSQLIYVRVTFIWFNFKSELFKESSREVFSINFIFFFLISSTYFFYWLVKLFLDWPSCWLISGKLSYGGKTHDREIFSINFIFFLQFIPHIFFLLTILFLNHLS